MSAVISNVRPKPDRVLVDIADYVTKYKITSKEALDKGEAKIVEIGKRLRAEGRR